MESKFLCLGNKNRENAKKHFFVFWQHSPIKLFTLFSFNINFDREKSNWVAFCNVVKEDQMKIDGLI